MQPEVWEKLLPLFTEVRVATLGVVVDGEPVQGLVPFAMDPEGPAALVHVSTLARHTRGLTAGASFSLLIHAPDAAVEHPLQVPRVTLTGRAKPLTRDTAAYQEARARYLARFPEAEITFTLADFRLVRLEVEKVRFVGGFAQAYNVPPQALAQHLQEVL